MSVKRKAEAWSVPLVKQVFRLLVFCTVFLSSSCQMDEMDIFVTEGQDKMLECQFNPAYTTRNPVYYWIRTNEKERDNVDNVAIGKMSLDNHYRVEFSPAEGKYQLYISNTTYNNDNGKFQCKVKESGTGMDLHNQVFQLTVLIPPGRPQIAPNSVTATEGRPYQLTCSSVGGSPDPEIQWFREGDPQPLRGAQQPGGNKDKPTVNIINIDPRREDDGAELTCKVTNKALQLKGSPQFETTTILNVNYIPRVSVQPQNPLRVERETPASATCRVDAKPQPISIKWNHNGRIVSNGANLSIMPTTADDAGTYVCIADNGLGTTGQAELTVDMLFGPSIHMETKREAQENEDVVVRCNVSANPAAKIEWFKEGDPNFRATGDVLRLERISSRSMGRYTCHARNELYPSNGPSPIKKTANATISIWIKHQPGPTVIFPENAVAVEGMSYSLMCAANPPGWPEPTYRWWKDVPSNTLPSGLNYTINQVRTINEGTYYCQATNDLGQGSIASVDLKVYEPPRILTPLPLKVTKRIKDSDVSVQCVARSKPRASVRWLKNGRILTSSGQYDISMKEQTEKNGVSVIKSTLHFFGPDRPNNDQLIVDDRGLYVCEFTNDVVPMPVASNMTLKIEHGPILRHTQRKVAFDVGSPAVLSCRMQAYPEPVFEWSFDNVVIGSGASHYNITKSDLGDDLYMSTLHIENVRENDYGEYSCSSSNSLDTTKTHIHLVQRQAPERPTSLEVLNVTHNSVLLHWEKGFNGGYEDTEYFVNYRSDSGDSSMVSCGTNNTCIIKGLTEMMKYHFQVQAKNDHGNSEFSSDVVTQTKIDSTNIPEPRRVNYSKDYEEVSFDVPETRLELDARVEVYADHAWRVYETVVAIGGQRNVFRLGTVEHHHLIQAVKVSLCLKNDSANCGKPVNATLGNMPALIRASAGITTENIIIIVVCSVIGILIAIAIIAVCCCCCRKNKKEKAIKKDFEMEAANARPKAITGPYYPEGIVNKGVDNSMDNDDINKGVHYGHIPAPNGIQPGMDRQGPPPHGMPNGNGIPPGYSYLDRDYNNSNGGSVDSQDSLWLKANGDVATDRSYSYDPSLSNAYLYPDEFHHMHEDLMNQRNREHVYSGASDPYAPIAKPKKRNEHMDGYHVSEMPDPYMEEEEKVPHNQISFDESLESGYSTPNSRSRRVIREIIV